MSTFEVKVYELRIEEHPNADLLELAVVGDYRSIVRKGQFKTGDLGVYIPEASVLPAWLITRLGLDGKLAGKAQNRVKAVKRRSILSQGLIYPLVQKMGGTIIETNDEKTNRLCVSKGQDVADLLEIIKWDPPIPVHMAGEVWNAFGYTVHYDIENLKKHPDILRDGEEVVLTEKLHGTFCCLGFHPELQEFIVHSKGLGGQGLALKLSAENAGNLYVKMLAEIGPILWNIMEVDSSRPTYLLGEIFGQGVQDLTYGQTKPVFRVFDVYNGPGVGYLGYHEKAEFCKDFRLQMAPTLYVGPYSKEIVDQYTSGKETLSGGEACIREGVVVTPTTERRDDSIGRVILKSVSEAYLLRKGDATEFN